MNTLQNSHIKDVEVIDGILHFKNYKVFSLIRNKLNSTTDEEIIEWRKSLGFLSYREILDQSYSDFEKLTSKHEYDNWIKKYKDIVYMDGDVVTPRIQLSQYLDIINRDGEYYIGETLYKITDDKFIAILNGDRSKIESALKLKSFSEKDGIRILEIPKPSIIDIRSDNFCRLDGYSGYGTETHNKRRVKIMVSTYLVYSDVDPNKVISKVTINVYPWKKTLLGWLNYKTLLAYDQMSFDLRDHNGDLHSISNKQKTESSKKKEIDDLFYYGIPSNYGPHLDYPFFEWIDGRGISSGVGDDHWAIVCCHGNYVTQCLSPDGPDPFP